jgi:hypothetical protein
MNFITSNLSEAGNFIKNRELSARKTILSDQDYEYFLQSYPLKQYHLNFIKYISTLFNFEDKCVLEIGGSNFPYELIKQRLKVKKWVSIDTPYWEKPKKDERIYTVGSGFHSKHPITIADIKRVKLFEIYDDSDYFIMKGFSQ